MTFGALSKTSASRPRLAIACCTCTIFSRYQSGGRRSGRFGAAACKETPKLRVRPNIEDREVKVKTAVPTTLRRNSRRTRESMARSGTRVEMHHLSAGAFRRESSQRKCNIVLLSPLKNKFARFKTGRSCANLSYTSSYASQEAI